MPEKSLTTALFSGKCPKCRQGDVFKYPLTKITRFGEMNEKCPVCDVSFMPEPGFYFGAMFISYALSVALLVTIAVALYVLANPSDLIYILSITLGAIAFTPFSFRFSRVSWLYMFGGIRYEPRLN